MKLSYRIFTAGLLVILISACQMDNGQSQSTTNQPQETTNMLQHTVYFYLNEDVTAEEKDQFEVGLKELLKIPEIHKSELGVPAETEERDVTDHSYAYAIYTWFENMDDYKVYAEHPDHLKFIEKYNHLWADVKVYDSQLTHSR